MERLQQTNPILRGGTKRNNPLMAWLEHMRDYFLFRSDMINAIKAPNEIISAKTLFIPIDITSSFRKHPQRKKCAVTLM